MKSVIMLLLLTSCAEYEPKTYIRTQVIRELGVRCAQSYYFSYKSGHCVYLPDNNTVYTPTGVQVKAVHSYQSSPERSIKLLSPRRRVLKHKVIDRKDQCRNWLNKGEL